MTWFIFTISCATASGQTEEPEQSEEQAEIEQAEAELDEQLIVVVEHQTEQSRQTIQQATTVMTASSKIDAKIHYLTDRKRVAAGEAPEGWEQPPLEAYAESGRPKSLLDQAIAEQRAAAEQEESDTDSE